MTGPTRTSPRTTLAVLIGIGVAMASNSALFGTQLMFDPRPFSEVASTPQHVTYYVVLLVLLAAFAQVLPRLCAVTGGTGRSFPDGVLVLLGVGVFFDAATRFGEAFMVPFLAAHAPELLDDTPSTVLMSAMVTSWVLYLIGLVTLGVVAYRRRIFPRPAAVLLMVGAVTVPVIGPLSGMLIGTALAWGGYAARRSAPQPAPVGVGDPVAV